MNEHFTKLENMMHSAPFLEFTGARVKISEGESVITMPVEKKFFHAAGAMHGALYFLALDNAAFFAANSLVNDVFVLTVTFNVYLIRPVSKGVVTATGKVVNITRSQFIAESIAYDSDNNEIARGSGIFVRSNMKLTEEMGYKL